MHARQLLQQLAVGLSYCHRLGLAHCSLHPRDLLLHRAPPASVGASGRRGGDAIPTPGSHGGAAGSNSLAAGGAAGATADNWAGLTLKLHSFGAALGAATGGACGGDDDDIASAWLCTAQDPSFSAPEVRFAEVFLPTPPSRDSQEYGHVDQP